MDDIDRDFDNCSANMPKKGREAWPGEKNLWRAKGLTLAMPASAGEICQGVYRGRERLASCTVDLFNRLALFPGRLNRRGKPAKNNASYKIRSSAYKSGEISSRPALYYYRLLPGAAKRPGDILKLHSPPPKFSQLFDRLCSQIKKKRLPGEISAVHISRIPLGAGMGSSTADLALIASGLYRLAGERSSPEKLARLLPRLEPTDSTIFSEITIFEQNYGSSWQRLGGISGGFKVLALRRPGSINTLSSRRFRQQPPDLHGCFELLKRAIEKDSLRLLGRAATFSAKRWSDRLEYPALEEIIDLALSCGFAGINAAHSGSILGAIFREDEADIEKFNALLERRGLSPLYPCRRTYRAVGGGIRKVSV